MTREEILGMSANQLAEATAVHVMGWEWCEPTITWNAVSSGYWWSLSLEEPVFDWNPGEDILAAFEVLEKMRERKIYLDIRVWPDEYQVLPHQDENNKLIERAIVKKKSLPEAICKAAALLAVLEG